RVRERPQGAGRRHEHRWLRGDRGRLRGGAGPGHAGAGPVAFGRRPAAGGGREPARGGYGVRRDDPCVGRGPADLRGAGRRGRGPGGAAWGAALPGGVTVPGGGGFFVPGPEGVRSVTGGAVDRPGPGGREPLSRRSGVVHVVAPTDFEAIERARELTVLLGDQGVIDLAAVQLDTVQDETMRLESGDRDSVPSPASVLPDSPRRAYDIKPLIGALLDGPGIELHPRWAPNVVTLLGRLGGRTVGVVANNPLRLGGCLDATSAEKAARFVRMCDAFGVPLVVLVDVPGYLPGVGQEGDGVVRRGAKLLHAFAEATGPRITLVIRKSYGRASIAMSSRALGAAKVFAWPGAEIAVMGPVAAIRILHRRALADVPPDKLHEVEADLAAEHQREAGGLDRAQALGVIDEIIEPSRTREALARAIAYAPQCRGSHGN